MIRLFAILIFISSGITSFAGNILVGNMTELEAANKNAKPGDVIILQAKEWNNVTIRLTCEGLPGKPITFKAAAPGKTLITGKSQLRIGGKYIVVDGLYFRAGYSGKDPVINFRTDDKNLANHCRVTNVVINDFNNPKRMDENYWVAFYGKNNRLDHCSFFEKLNMGVLLAVILDDDRSRENFHSIDHNHFGHRPPLASNSGEIIRVGVSQHCEFNSNTQITDNYFEECDGETEIVSIKSCSNVVRGNFFSRCQGGVVLRHGNYNVVENNIFYGDNKPGTGGVRVINKGQWVVNNFFYKCRGVDFRSPLSIMNGIPNSPAHRYVQVTDAVIANNTFFDCAPISFGEGSDAERTVAPTNVLFANNIFYNKRDSLLLNIYDKLEGFTFRANSASLAYQQVLPEGFFKAADFSLASTKIAAIPYLKNGRTYPVADSLASIAFTKNVTGLRSQPGFRDETLLKSIAANAFNKSGANWYKPAVVVTSKPLVANCTTGDELEKTIEEKVVKIIRLTGSVYKIRKPLQISVELSIVGDTKSPVVFETEAMPVLFQLMGSGRLTLSGLNIDAKKVKATHFIASDTSGSSSHYNLTVTKCKIAGLGIEPTCKSIFYAHKSMVADEITIHENEFVLNRVDGFIMNEEKDDKGYYNAEKITIADNIFNNQTGVLLSIYRGGNDESTMGPNLFVGRNDVRNCSSGNDQPLISLTGVQVSWFLQNKFANCNMDKLLMSFRDTVRARHLLEENAIIQSGHIKKNQFVKEVATVAN